jgi:cytochrome c-type biogenesis protein
MELFSLFESVPAVSPLAFALVALAGLTMGLAPSSLPLFSIVLGYAVGPEGDDVVENRSRGLWLASGFVLGMATVDATIGALFGFLGSAVIALLSSYLVYTNLFLAAVLVIFGFALLRIVHFRFPVMAPMLRRVNSFPAAYALGIPFGLSACPACTPMILPILGAAAASGEPWLGAALLFVFGVARGLPLVVAGAGAGMIKHVRQLATWRPRIERASGWLMLLAAAFFLYQAAAYAELVIPFRFLFVKI